MDSRWILWRSRPPSGRQFMIHYRTISMKFKTCNWIRSTWFYGLTCTCGVGGSPWTTDDWNQWKVRHLDFSTHFHQVVIWFDQCNIFLLIYLLTESSGFLLRVLHSGERGGSDGGKLFLRPPGSGATELPGIKPVQHSGCISVWLLGWYYLCSINHFFYEVMWPDASRSGIKTKRQ